MTTRALLMGAGWAINVAVAEWIIRGRPLRWGVRGVRPQSLEEGWPRTSIRAAA